MLFFASQGSAISRKAQRPRPPWLLTAGTHSVRAVATLAAVSWVARVMENALLAVGHMVARDEHEQRVFEEARRGTHLAEHSDAGHTLLL